MNEENVSSALSPELSKYLKEELNKETGQFSQEFLDNLKLEIKLFLLEIDNVIYRFNHQFALSQLMNDNDIKLEVRRYIVAKQMISQQPEIEQLLKTGYQIIDELRQAFTGEEVKYFVGVTVGRSHQLYEGYLTMQQILALTRLEPIWKNTASSVFKLRFSASKGSLISMLKPASQAHSTLYSSIASYASTHGIRNEGNIFEAYRIMVDKQQSNNIPPAEWDQDIFDITLEQVINMTRKNVVSFAKGGDFLDESIKFFGGQNPSLASLSTIKNILSAFLEILNMDNISAIRTSLSVLFEKNTEIDNLCANSLSEVDLELNEFLSILNKL